MTSVSYSVSSGIETDVYFYDTENNRYTEIDICLNLRPDCYFVEKMFFNAAGALYLADIFISGALLQRIFFANGAITENHVYQLNPDGSIALIEKRDGAYRLFETDKYAYINGRLSSIAKINSSGQAMEIDLYANGQLSKTILVAADPNSAAGYYSNSLPLYGSANMPVISDVNQQGYGDCFLLAALAGLAQTTPSFISSMIKDDGQGIYSVRFFENGAADWIAVDNQVSMIGAHSSVDSWVALVEKAYVVFNSQYKGAANDYAALNLGGWDDGLRAITGDTTTNYFAWDGDLSSWEQEVAAVKADLAAGEVVMYGSYQNTNGANGKADLVANHMLTVTGFDDVTGKFVLRNPWGSTYGAPGWNITFEESALQLYGTGNTLNGSAYGSGAFIVNNSGGAVSNAGQLTQSLASLPTPALNAMSMINANGSGLATFATIH